MTLLVSHRGACLEAPENTFAAADAAIARGAAYVEFDVRRTADGAYVVMHDRDVSRTTDGAGLVDQLTAADIDRLDAGAWFGDAFKGQPVPRVEDFARHLAGRVGAYCEVKRGNAAEIVSILRHAGLEDVFFWSFKPEVRSALRDAAPDMRHMITHELAGSPQAAIANHGASFYEFTLSDVSPKQLEAAKSAGLKTMIFEPGAHSERVEALLAMEPDYANIDDLAGARRVLDARTG